MIKKLSWEKANEKYGHTPTKYTQRVASLFALLRELDSNTGTTPMPTLHQKNEDLVESFPKGYQTYFELVRGNDYTLPMSTIGQLLEDHFDRENDDSDDSGDDDSDDISDDDESSSDDDSDSGNEKKKKKKSKKRRYKKFKKVKKRNKSKKKKTKKVSGTPKPMDTCRIHGGHFWFKCRRNPRGDAYDPPKPFGTYSG